MNLLDLGILALVEGAADALAVDSSAHSLLAARLLHLRATPVAAALHLGMALALAAYFWRDMRLIGNGLWKLRKLRVEPGTWLLLKMLTASLPPIVALAWLGKFGPQFGDLLFTGIDTVIFAALMLLTDRLSLTVKRIEHIGAGTTVSVGLLQLAALLPGVGRSAAALTMARVFGMERQDAYRFTLLVSLPILLAQAIGEFADNGRRGHSAGLPDLLACGLAFFAVLLAVSLGFSLIRRAGLMPVVIYRLFFGAALIGLGLL